MLTRNEEFRTISDDAMSYVRDMADTLPCFFLLQGLRQAEDTDGGSVRPVQKIMSKPRGSFAEYKNKSNH